MEKVLDEWQLLQKCRLQSGSKLTTWVPMSLVVPESSTQQWGHPRNRKVGTSLPPLSVELLSLQASHLPRSLCTLPVFLCFCCDYGLLL